MKVVACIEILYDFVLSNKAPAITAPTTPTSSRPSEMKDMSEGSKPNGLKIFDIDEQTPIKEPKGRA